MIIFLPSGCKGGFSKCGEGVITRFLYWTLAMLVGFFTMEFFQVKDIYELLFGTIIIIGMTLHTIIYMNLYDKKLKKNMKGEKNV